MLKDSQEIAAIRKASQVASEVMAELVRMVRPGLLTKALDAVAARGVAARGGVASFKGYRGYPSHVCVSVNDEVIHGIPGDRKLREGDLVSVDLGVGWEGWYSDMAYTVVIPPVSPEAQRLVNAARGALEAGLRVVRPGRRVGDISEAIQRHAESHGCSVIREYVGHGIGAALHEDPPIPNFGSAGQGPRLKPGMVLCIEPMLSVGHWKVNVKGDRWTAVTVDGSLAAHLEHTVLVAEGGHEVLTWFPEVNGTAQAKVLAQQGL